MKTNASAKLPLFLLGLFAWLPQLASAEVQLNPIFADEAVLQQGVAVPVWGTAAPGEIVTVDFAGQKQTATAAADGSWQVKLTPLTISAENRVMTVTGSQTATPLTVKNLLVGEVWLCSGQSNMEWALGRSTGGPEAVAASANPLYRLCTISHNTQMSPVTTEPAHWVVSGDASTKFFSAVGWWFGSKLQKELGEPVGIINDSFGGTQIQCWLPLETLKKGPWPQDKSTDIGLAKDDYDARKAKMQPVMDKFLADKADAIKNKTTPPTFPVGWPGDFRGPSTLWNGMVAPILKFPVRGVVWYQGESNAYVRVADTYRQLLPALISDWRTGFGQPELPFVICQIAPNRKLQVDPNELSGIAVIQEAEFKTVQVTPHTGLVVTMDLGETNVHYLRKEPAGERVMKVALALAYGRNGADAFSPVYQSLDLTGGKAVIHFTQGGGGLVAQGGPLAGFVIAGADKKFVFADASIAGDTVVVSSPQVPNPVAVRYGWADFPKVNFFGKNGLPASPFRTDDWDVDGPVATPPDAGH